MIYIFFFKSEVISLSGIIIRIRIKTDKLMPKFLHHFMKSKSTRDILTREGGGTNINNINQAKLSNIKVPIPPL